MKTIIIIAIGMLIAIPSYARRGRVMPSTCIFLCDFTQSASRRPAAALMSPFGVAQTPARIELGARGRPYRRHHEATTRDSSQIVSHPSGCPRIAFCGCGAALRVFGVARRDLWLAAAWFKFPRAHPAPGMVAVRNHHVFVLEHQNERGEWVVYDANSGGHLTRIHPRPLDGYVIVNPHG